MCEEWEFAFKSSHFIIVPVQLSPFRILYLITNFKLVIIFIYWKDY